MKWSFATVGVIMLGIIGVAIILLFQSITTNNENDYYLLKEVTEAAMIDAIDIPYYRETGDLKIVKEKFVENFTRRFAESTIFVSSTYTIKSYDIIETPPKVSVVIDTGLGEFTIGGNTDDYSVQNKLDAILEYIGDKTDSAPGSLYYNNPYINKTIEKEYYAITTKTIGNKSFEIYQSLKLPSELNAPNIKDVSIGRIKYNGIVNSQSELNEALLKNNLSFHNNNISNYMQDIKDFATSVNLTSIDLEYYNCGISRDNYRCDNNNLYWASIKGLTNEINKDKIILKYKVVWSYKEYEFSN